MCEHRYPSIPNQRTSDVKTASVCRLACVTAMCVSLFSCARASARVPATSWRLVWSDEFNGRTLDLKKWNVLTRETSKHGELQYYVPDEVYLENGNLRIRSRVRDYGGMHFTSGRLSTDKRGPPHASHDYRSHRHPTTRTASRSVTHLPEPTRQASTRSPRSFGFGTSSMCTNASYSSTPT